MIYAYKLTIGFKEKLTRLTNQNAKETMDQQNFACSSVANDRHRNHFIEGKTCQRMVVADRNDDINGQQNGARHMNNNIDDVDFNLAGDLNPMFIPSIINHVASFLPCSDLKRCRFLNKQWEEECTKHLRQKGLVKFVSKAGIDRYSEEFHGKRKLFENFSFELLTKGMETNKFFDVFGVHIKCFKIDFSTEYYQHHPLSMRVLFYLIFEKLPNLEELSLVGCISDDDHFLPKDKRRETEHTTSSPSGNFNNKSYDITKLEETKSGPSSTSSSAILPLLKYLEIFLYNASGKDVSKHQFLIELLSCVPNMTKISVPKVPRMLSFGMPLLHTLVTTSELRFRKLQHLEMDIALYNGLIEVLKSKRFPLKYLNAEINSSVTEESLHSLMTTLGKTLTTLQLKFPRSPVASSLFKSASCFQCLRHLTLHGYKGPLNFLEELSLLEYLEIIDNSYAVATSRDVFKSPFKPIFSYKMIWTHWHEESYVFDAVNSSDVQLLRQFAANFLNLTKLNLPHLNDNDLSVIYETFHHSLQELTMENSLCSDIGITGDSRNPLKRPFIGNLTRLRKLEILSPSIEMTDASITSGIIFCKNLKILIIRNATSITDTGLLKAVDFLELEKLEMTMCANINGLAVKYALEKMTDRGMNFIWNMHQSRLSPCFVNRLLNGNSASVTCIVP